MRAHVRVYRPVPMDGYEWALPIEDADFERFRRLGEDARKFVSRPPQMRLLRVDDDGKLLKPAGLPWLGSHVLVLRDSAISVLGPLLAPFGKVIQLASNDADLAVFNANSLPGVLDEERSEIVRLGSGRILDIKRPILHDEVLSGVGAFKLPEMPRGDLYLTEDLVDAIRATGQSTGTDFLLVYESGIAAR